VGYRGNVILIGEVLLTLYFSEGTLMPNSNAQLSLVQAERRALSRQSILPISVFSLLTLLLLLSLLMTLTPSLRRTFFLTTEHLQMSFAPGLFLAQLSFWWPRTLGAYSQGTSATIEVTFALLVAFVCYGLALLLVSRIADPQVQHWLRVGLWVGVVAGGLILASTSGLFVNDPLVYASYSRLLAVYHANPYFVVMQAFPHDPLTSIDNYAQSVAAYGPLWLLVCGFWGFWLPASAGAFVLAFRTVAVTSLLASTWLVGRTLKTLGRSPSVVTTGMVLYAWNPLVLLESCVGAHNDAFMLFLVLLGIYLGARAEKRDTICRLTGYGPAVVALALAAMVKFTALPVLFAFVLYVLCKATQERRRVTFVRTVLPILCWAGGLLALVVLACYGPFWLGHSPAAILSSFRTPPSSIWAVNSYLRDLIDWRALHPAWQYQLWMIVLTKRKFWDALNALLVLFCLAIMLVTLRRRPTYNTFLTLALAMMCVLLLVTPWFFSWYITWIVGLAAVALPRHSSERSTSWIALALVYSVTALGTYFLGIVLGAYGYLGNLCLTLPPICAFALVTLLQFCDTGAPAR
jgi:hypothetical protein